MNEGFLVGMLAATLRMSTPLILGSLGEVITEKSGSLNLGIEGQMVLGAFVGFLTLFHTGDPWLGVLAGGAAGALSGLLLGYAIITRKAQQHACGLGLTIALTGLSLYQFERLQEGSSLRLQSEPLRFFEPLGGLPVVGQLARQYPVTYFALLLIPLIHTVLFNTALGLRIRAVGERPVVADTLGVSVTLTRYIALIIGSALIGVAGAFLSVAQLGYFSYDIVAGRGWICLAIVALGDWKPVGAVLGALLFGGVGALQLRLQTVGRSAIPFQVFLMFPYLVAVIVVPLLLRRRVSSPPASLAVPYEGLERR